MRKEAPRARVLMYGHRELSEGITLSRLADDLLQQVLDLRLMNVSNKKTVFLPTT